MKRLRWVPVFVLVPALGALGLSSGCSSEKPSEKPAAKSGGAEPAKAVSGAKEELIPQGTGTLKGKVVYDGTPPEIKKDIVAENNKDKDYCRKGDAGEFTWRVGPDKGVANVVVWLRAPKGKYFKIPEDQKKRNDVVKIDQPFCAFEPHVVTIFPSYFDGKKQEPTGEKFEIANSATITHNTNWNPEDATLIKGDNVFIKAKSEPHPIAVRPSKERQSGGEQLVSIKCNIHGWMSAYAWVFDHPFSAVSKADGTFEIKEVPAGVPVEIEYWHEDLGKKEHEKTTLKSGENDIEIKVKK